MLLFNGDDFATTDIRLARYPRESVACRTVPDTDQAPGTRLCGDAVQSGTMQACRPLV